MQQTLVSWRDAAQRGYAWLAKQVDQTPPFGVPNADINWFAKTVWPLAACGDRVRALRVLLYVQQHILEKGTLHQPQRTDWTNAVPYALGWLVTGARYCEAFDLAKLFYTQMSLYVCTDTGGLFSSQLGSRSEDARCDAAIQGALLHAAMAAGDLAQARKTADFMVALVERQPERHKCFYTHYHPRLAYKTDIDHDDPGPYAFVAGGSQQPFANLGFALQAMLQLFDLTGHATYQDTPKRVIDWLLDACRSDLLSHSQNHKIAHAALLLYRQTGVDKYRDTAVTITEKMSENIQADGRALADVWFADIADQPDYATLRTTCDSVLWLAQICNEFDGRVL